MTLHLAARHAVCSASCNWHNTFTYVHHHGWAAAGAAVFLIVVFGALSTAVRGLRPGRSGAR